MIDIHKQTDPILDAIWYLTSFTIGICYPFVESPMSWASKVTTLFIQDFISNFLKKW